MNAGNNDKKILEPFAVLEIISARHDKTMKRMCLAFVVAICVLAICNCVMFCFWCNRVNKNVDANKQEIVELISEVHSDGKE